MSRCESERTRKGAVITSDQRDSREAYGRMPGSRPWASMVTKENPS